MLFTNIYDTFLGLTSDQRRQLGLKSLSYSQTTDFAARVKVLVDADRVDVVELMLSLIHI